MIVADRKPLEEIIGSVSDCGRILVAGCNECVTVCEAGGRKEVGVLASALRLYFLNQGKEATIGEVTLERQCDREYVQELRDVMGGKEERGVWGERCQGCGSCLWARTAGICPVSRCAKRILNGPCGGSTGGKCEISKDVDCAWQLIIDRLKALGRMDKYEEIIPLKDWSTDRAGGPRRVVREDVRQ